MVLVVVVQVVTTNGGGVSGVGADSSGTHCVVVGWCWWLIGLG